MELNQLKSAQADLREADSMQPRDPLIQKKLAEVNRYVSSS